jgi:hypothetical protein
MQQNRGMGHDIKTKAKQERQKKNLTPLAAYTRLDKTKVSYLNAL